MPKTNNFFSNKMLKLLSFSLAAFCLIKAWDYGQANAGLDFYQFWVVGQKIIKEKKINIYSDGVRRSIGSEFFQEAYNGKSLRLLLAAGHRKAPETYSTPFLYSLFGLFSSKDYDGAYVMYQFFCMACMVFAIMTLSKLLRFPFTVSMLFLVFFTTCFDPYLSDLRVANVDQIQLGFIALFLWLQSRYDLKAHNFLGGIVLGILIIFKPNLAFVLLLLSISWLMRRQFKKIALEYMGITISVVSALIFSGIMFGSMQCWSDWLRAGMLMPANVIPVGLGNFSFARLIVDWIGINVTKYLMAGLVSITALFIWLGNRKPVSDGMEILKSEFFEDTLLVGLGCLIYLLSAPLVWIHYYILAIPAIIFILRPIDNFGSQISKRNIVISRTLSVFAVIMISLTPVQIFFGFKSPYHIAIMVVAGTFLLFILAMQELKSRAY